MKKNKLLLCVGVLFSVTIPLAVLSLPCSASDSSCSSEVSSKVIHGNGKIINKSVVIPEFDALNVNGNFDVNLISSKQNNVTITADENIMPYVRSNVGNKALRINLPGVSYSSSQTIKAVVNTGQTIHKIDLGGKNSFQGTVNSNQLALTMNGKNIADLKGDIKKIQIHLSGNSELHLDIKNADHMDLNVSGDGLVYLSGITKKVFITTAGNATVLAKNLVADDVKIKSAGKSEVTIHASNSLSVASFGNSNVKYSGDPKISKTGFGETTVEKLGNN